MVKPYEAEVGGRELRLFPDEHSMSEFAKRHPKVTNLAIFIVFLFRKTPEQDYIKTYIPEEETEIVTYEQREFAIWLGGVALTPEDEHDLQSANRSNYSFAEQNGWNPMVAIKDSPTETEQENYIIYQAAKLSEEWAEGLD